ncbi:sugar-binding transcriptional regulator [Leucobacter sp. wl10]|uniref:sugar-binding transcriptional regulator n=1 Tax=Leucobacter sp. wl10 TaxID=2304677 RepID=UPI0013C30FFD|nr:sugar-binding domain-containing protein [Leucobacter sp. wl10]
MYHEERMGQPAIAKRLNLSQSQISRLLREAQDNGVIRTLVVTPTGLYSELEEELRRRFDLLDVVVADAPDDDAHAVTSAIGTAAAVYLEHTLGRGERLGVSSRSAALQATVDVMSPVKTGAVETVVQSLGAVGDAAMRAQASRLTGSFAHLTRARPIYLATPGVLTSQVVRDGLLADAHIAEAASAWRSLTTLVTGIGAMSAPHRTGGSALAESDSERLQRAGAVGDMCLNFFDEHGATVPDELSDRVIGISEGELRAVPRRIAVAGGPQKSRAILAACRGGWANVLVTDQFTAERLCA